ncbi:hypothetical protein [Fundidesulfovibrio soli]|uniref:hypothetical protein n=1 Tax=Fundidesulfovibrio soli TaxID=2922716 RepID=UPI001FAE8E5A|nr:hypothetical protein [Fundidesulfovibrio soli]
MLQTLSLKFSELEPGQRFQHDEAVLVLPFIDPRAAELSREVLTRRALADGLLVLVEDDRRMGFVGVANALFARSESKYFGYLAEDAFPSDGWLKCALFTLENSGACLLAFNDGRFHGNLAVFGLASRAWARALYRTCLFFPGYKSHFADVELSAIARAQEVMTYNPNCVLMEVDHLKHTKSNSPDDDTLYRKRASAGFGGLVPPFEPD